MHLCYYMNLNHQLNINLLHKQVHLIDQYLLWLLKLTDKYSKVWLKQKKKLNKPVIIYFFFNLINFIVSFFFLFNLAAEKALRSFSDLPFQLPDDTTTNETETLITTLNTDNDLSNNSSIASTENNDNHPRVTSSPNIAEPREIQSGLSPLYLLNQLKRDAQFELLSDHSSSSSIPTEQHEFKIAVIVDGKRFIGIGRNKKLAKTKAAQLALEKLFGMCFDKEGKKNES